MWWPNWLIQLLISSICRWNEYKTRRVGADSAYAYSLCCSLWGIQRAFADSAHTLYLYCSTPTHTHTQTHIEIINAILGIRFLHLIELQENWAQRKRVRRGQAVSNDVLIMHNYELHALSHSALFSLSLSVCLPLAAGALITHRCVEILKLIAHISRHTTLNRHLYIALSLSRSLR